MKALVKYEAGPQKVKLMEREVPNPAHGQVRIKVCYSGICGTDIHIFNDDGGYKTNPPVTLGHEFSGIVDKAGEGVDECIIHKRVISETYYYTCGTCFYCESGHKNLCPHRKSIGSGVDGAMAEYIVVPAKNLHIIPDNISLMEAAMTEPLACCAQAVLEKGNISAGDKVLITGPGAIGLMCLQLALLSGGRVIVMGMKCDEERLQLAKKLGAELTIYSDGENAEEQIRGAFGEFGADIIFECSGSVSAINLALNAVRKGGRYIQVGLTGRLTTLDMNLITLKELEILGTFAQKTIWWKRSLELVHKGKIHLEPLISKVVQVENWQEAFEQYSRGIGLKYMLLMSQEV